VLGRLVVHDVDFWREPFFGEVLELHFVCIENADVVKARNGLGQNCICFIMVHGKKQTLPSSKMNGNDPVK
jgi:hypothetical protein